MYIFIYKLRMSIYIQNVNNYIRYKNKEIGHFTIKL